MRWLRLKETTFRSEETSTLTRKVEMTIDSWSIGGQPLKIHKDLLKGLMSRSRLQIRLSSCLCLNEWNLNLRNENLELKSSEQSSTQSTMRWTPAKCHRKLDKTWTTNDKQSKTWKSPQLAIKTKPVHQSNDENMLKNDSSYKLENFPNLSKSGVQWLDSPRTFQWKSAKESSS